MQTRLRVAAAQIECVPGDIEANLARHLSAIEEAHRFGVDLLVFPELSLTDYETIPDTGRLARDRHAPELVHLAKAAGHMTVAVGFIERTEDGLVYNAQALLGGGRVPHVHRKINLPNYGRLQEAKHYAAGRTVDVHGVGGPWAASTLVCADTWNPALPWLAALRGANLFIVPIASSLGAVGGDFDNPAGWEVNARHTALTYGSPLVMANHCGTRGGLTFWGGSRILDASGRELARALEVPAVIWADVSHVQSQHARELLPTMRNAVPELVLNELSRFLPEVL